MNSGGARVNNADVPNKALTNATLDKLGGHVAVPGYDRRCLKAGIAHIGVGNFHRAHQALYIDRLLHLPGHHDWAICGIGLGIGAGSVAKGDALRAQDGLYTLTEFSPDGAANTIVVGAIIEYLHAPSAPDAVLAKLADPAIRIVSLTITEGGYNLDGVTGAFRLNTPDIIHDLRGGPPRTVFGFIVEALRRRRATGIAPFTVLSCDNLRGNGDTTRRAVLGFAHALDADLAKWIDGHVAFPNSMVDRIVPQVTGEVRAKANSVSGIDDASPVIAETFTQWVVQDRFSAGQPAFEAVGVELRDDVDTYEALKGRMLNAAHMLLAYPAILLGHRLVHDAIRDPDLAALLDTFFVRDVIPVLTVPDGVSAHDYAAKTCERFGNAALADQLLRVAHDGASKIPIFHGKTIGALAEGAGDMRREALLLACFRQYLTGLDDNGDGFPVHEPQLDAADWRRMEEGDPLAVLRISPFSALRLDENPGFVAQFHAMRRAVARGDTRDALRGAIDATHP
jgi:mannitol 2-dehydrogenase